MVRQVECLDDFVHDEIVCRAPDGFFKPCMPSTAQFVRHFEEDVTGHRREYILVDRGDKEPSNPTTKEADQWPVLEGVPGFLLFLLHCRVAGPILFLLLLDHGNRRLCRDIHGVE